MSRGVPKEMAIKAKEQLDKQQRLVSRLRTDVDQLDRQLRQKRIDLSNEEAILDYYQAHPALKGEGLPNAAEIARSANKVVEEQLPFLYAKEHAK